MKKIKGMIPVMLTPFTDDNQVDYPGLGRLIDWYLDNGADALFAVCHSSEMVFLTLEERVAICQYVVHYTKGRIPIIASGHVAHDIDDQIEELNQIAKTGIDVLILATNQLDLDHEGSDAFLANLDKIIKSLPKKLPLGLYECPAPNRRLVSDEELLYCANTERFVLLKDLSCDLSTISRRVQLVKDSQLAIINSNSAIAYEAVLAGSKGFSGVFTNFHPGLYHWICHHCDSDPVYAKQLSWFLSLSAVTEALGYPKNAKVFHQKRGTFSSTHSRAIAEDILEKHWGLEVILDQISAEGKWHRGIIEDKMDQ
jgi:4-hydroxy-tetrahydrodipicolinate synthase